MCSDFVSVDGNQAVGKVFVAQESAEHADHVDLVIVPAKAVVWVTRVLIEREEQTFTVIPIKKA